MKIENDTITWKDIPGYEGFYAASTCGKVRSLDRCILSKRHGKMVNLRGMPMKGRISKCGYPRVGLHKCGKLKEFRIHSLIAMTFIPNPLGKRTVNHIDAVKTNNNVENLEWCTPQENSTHAQRMGLLRPPRGESHGSAVLTWSKVRAIRKYVKLGGKMGNIAIGKKYGISSAAIGRVINNKQWRE